MNNSSEMMIEAKKYKGIVYIRISELPESQKIAIQNWLNDEVLIKIQTKSALFRDCVLYKDYRHWFNKIYTTAVPMETREQRTEVKSSQRVGGLALTNPKRL